VKALREGARGLGLFAFLIIAATALAFIAFHPGSTGLSILLAVAVVLAGLVALFLASQRQPSPRSSDETTLLTPTIVVNEVRAAASYRSGWLSPGRAASLAG
jgi:hypothetical protein